jgi:hypothetical protein
MQTFSTGFRTLLVSTIVTGLTASPAFSDLLTPDWNSPPARAYLERDRAAEPSTSDPGKPLNIPVIGFFPGFNEAQPSAVLREKLINRNDTAALNWPTCAVEPQQPTPIVRDESGTWFTQDYDFGCVLVSINGDRNTDDSDTSLARTPDGEAVASVEDETNSGLANSLTLTVNRFGLPYVVSIECFDEIKSLCQPSGPWQALINRLSIVGGTP